VSAETVTPPDTRPHAYLDWYIDEMVARLIDGGDLQETDAYDLSLGQHVARAAHAEAASHRGSEKG